MYMGSLAMYGKSGVGNPVDPIMPPDTLLFVEEPEYACADPFTCRGRVAVEVSSVYANGPEVMDRKK